MGPRRVWMSLPLEVPETVGGSLCSDSSFQNLPPPHPHLLIYHWYGWAGREQEEWQNKNSPETGDQQSGLLLAADSTVQLHWQVLQLSYPQRCVREGTSNSSPSLSLSARRVKLTLWCFWGTLCWWPWVFTGFALQTVPGRGLECHSVTHPHLPAPLCAKCKMHRDSLNSGKGDIWGCKKGAESRFGVPILAVGL